MAFEDFYLVTHKISPIEPSELDMLEAKLGTPLPPGYREFMTRFGEGTFCGFLRVYPPKRILESDEATRKRWDEYFFWERGADVLTKEQVMQSVVFADSIDSDELIQSPHAPDQLFVLPRHDVAIYRVPEAFNNPLEWQSARGAEHTPPTFRYFEPWADNRSVEYFTSRTDHELADVRDTLLKPWPDAFAHELAEDEDDWFSQVLFEPIGGALQLTQSGDGRVRVRIEYDADNSAQVDKLTAILQSMDFYETSRSAG